MQDTIVKHTAVSESLQKKNIHRGVFLTVSLTAAFGQTQATIDTFALMQSLGYQHCGRLILKVSADHLRQIACYIIRDKLLV